MQLAIKIPAGVPLDDWLALNIVEFYNRISLLYAPLDEICQCPEMTAGDNFKYYWQDDKKYKKPTSLPAKRYISKVMDMVESYMNDPRVFPEDDNVPFPPDFKQIAGNIMRRLFRIYSHMYWHHIKEIKKADLEAVLNTSFKHFTLFAKEYKLIPEEQLEPMAKIIKQF